MSKRITRTVTTVVTDLRLDNGRLVAHAVNQTKEGVVVASHDLNVGLEELPAKARTAAEAIVKHVDQWADKA